MFIADVEEEIAAGAGRRERLPVGAGLEARGELGPDVVDIDRARRVDRGHAVVGGQEHQRPRGKRCVLDHCQRLGEGGVGVGAVRADVVHQPVDPVEVDKRVGGLRRSERGRRGREALLRRREREHVRAAEQHPVR